MKTKVSIYGVMARKMTQFQVVPCHPQVSTKMAKDWSCSNAPCPVGLKNMLCFQIVAGPSCLGPSKPLEHLGTHLGPCKPLEHLLSHVHLLGCEGFTLVYDVLLALFCQGDTGLPLVAGQLPFHH